MEKILSDRGLTSPFGQSMMPSMSEKTDPAAFLKKLGSEPYPLTEKQKELLRLIEKNRDTKLIVVMRPLRRGNTLSNSTILGNRPTCVIFDEADKDSDK